MSSSHTSGVRCDERLQQVRALVGVEVAGRVRRLDRAQTVGPSAERGYEAGRVGFSDENIGSWAMYGSSRAISFSRNSIAFT